MERSVNGFGKVRVGRWRNVVVSGVLPVVLNVFVWPLALTQAPPAVVVEEPLQALWYVIPLAGLAFLVWWVRMVARTARWGPLHFELTGEPPHPGGRVRGRVVTGARSLPAARPGADALAAAAGPECRVTLRCIAQRNRPGKSRKRVERVLAEISDTVAMERAVTVSGRQVRVPVDLDIPANAATTNMTNEHGEWIWWEVAVESTTVRPALHAVIRLPVVHVGGSGTVGADGSAGRAARNTAPGTTAPGTTALGTTDGAGAARLVTTEPRELMKVLEQERAVKDPRSVAGRIFRSRDVDFRMGTTHSEEMVVVSLRGDGAVRDVWSGLLLLVGLGSAAAGLVPVALVVLAMIFILRAALRPVLVRAVAAADGLTEDTVRRRKVRTRRWAWPEISTCRTMAGTQRMSRRGRIMQWDLMIQAGTRSAMVAVRTEDEEAGQALAGEINRRALECGNRGNK